MYMYVHVFGTTGCGRVNTPYMYLHVQYKSVGCIAAIGWIYGDCRLHCLAQLVFSFE